MEQTLAESGIIAQKYILLSDHLVIKAFKYTFLWKGHSSKIDPYSISKLLMCQMVSPSRQRISANFGGNHLLNYLVSQHVSEPVANQNLTCSMYLLLYIEIHSTLTEHLPKCRGCTKHHDRNAKVSALHKLPHQEKQEKLHVI